MSAEYKETQVGPDDTQNQILETLSGGHPWAFVVCKFDEDGEINLAVEVGGGIRDAKTLRNLLEKTIKALP